MTATQAAMDAADKQLDYAMNDIKNAVERNLV